MWNKNMTAVRNLYFALDLMVVINEPLIFCTTIYHEHTYHVCMCIFVIGYRYINNYKYGDGASRNVFLN
jgi:hypothetical protein